MFTLFSYTPVCIIEHIFKAVYKKAKKEGKSKTKMQQLGCWGGSIPQYNVF